MSKPTHVLRTLRESYLVDLGDNADLQLIRDLIGTTNGNLKVTYMVEDNRVYDRTVYIDKMAVIACRALVSIEEI